MAYRAGEGYVGRVVTDRRPFICNDTLVDERVSRRIVGPEGIRSFMHVPLVLGERVYGVVSVNSHHPRAFGERELRVIDELARHAASALQNALQFEQERHIAETLQQALLAEELPEVPGLELAALYQAAGRLAGRRRLLQRLAARATAGSRCWWATCPARASRPRASPRWCGTWRRRSASTSPSPAELVPELNDLLCVRMADGDPGDPGAGGGGRGHATAGVVLARATRLPW